MFFLKNPSFWTLLTRKSDQMQLSWELIWDPKVFKIHYNSHKWLWNSEGSKHIYFLICQSESFPGNKGWTVCLVPQTCSSLWPRKPQPLTKCYWWSTNLKIRQRVAYSKSGEKHQQILVGKRMSFPGQEENNTGISENPQAMVYLFGLFIELLRQE